MNAYVNHRLTLDWDLTQHEQPIVFNLELMKLATYNMQKRNIVKMIPAWDETRYSKIILRKDYEDEFYPSHIFNNPKAECGGLVFSNNIYKPMDMKIEKSLPEPAIYNAVERIYQYNAESRYRFKSMITSPHLRMSMDGSTIWENWECALADSPTWKTFNFIIHDQYPAQIEGITDEINRILPDYHSQGRRLGFKYPLEITNEKSFRQWGAIRKLKYMSNMRLNCLFDDILFKESIETGGILECEYNLPLDHYNDENLIKIYLQTIFLRENHSKILLTIADKKPVRPELQQTLQLINEYSEYCYKTHQQVTMHEWTRRWCKWLKIDKINLFEYIRETNYPLFKLFYECLTTIFVDDHFESRFIWRANGGNI